MEKNSHLNPKPINETMCQSDNDDENRPFRNQKVINYHIVLCYIYLYSLYINNDDWLISKQGCMQLVDEFIRSECKMFIGLGVGLAGFSVI